MNIAIWAIKQMNLDVVILTEVKITGGIYTRSYLGYRVICTEAIHSSQDGIALVICERKDDNTLVDYFHVEAERRHRPNVMSFQIGTGRQRFACIGAYVPPG